MPHPVSVQLKVHLDDNDALVVSFLSLDDRPTQLRPERGLRDLYLEHSEAGALTLEVNDLFQRHTIYQVWAATLDGDGRTITAHWRRTECGVRHTIELSSEEAAAKLKLVIGATPRQPGVALPIPFASRPKDGGGSLPVPVSPDPKGQGGDDRQ